MAIVVDSGAKSLSTEIISIPKGAMIVAVALRASCDTNCLPRRAAHAFPITIHGKTPGTRGLMLASLCVSGLLVYSGAQGAELPELVDTSPPIDEIVVTAQKRASTVQTTPISITAVSGEDLTARGVASLAALAQGHPAFR